MVARACVTSGRASASRARSASGQSRPRAGPAPALAAARRALRPRLRPRRPLAGHRSLVGRPAERPLAVELHPAAAPPARRGPPGPRRHRRQQLRRGRTLRRREPLAERAEVRRADADHDPPDRPAAAGARLPGALVDVEALLHLAVAVGRGVVVDRAAAPLDRLAQDLEHVAVERALVPRAQRGGGPERVQPRAPQRLVGVDVPDAHDERLVHEQRLEAGPPPAQPCPPCPQREPRVERLGAEVVEGVVVRRVQPDPPELAHVPEADLAAVVEHQGGALVRIHGDAGRHHEQLPGHLEVDRQEGAAVEVDQHVLAAPADALDAPAGHPGDERGRVLVTQRPGPRDARAGDPRAGSRAIGQQVAPEVTGDGLDLG